MGGLWSKKNTFHCHLRALFEASPRNRGVCPFDDHSAFGASAAERGGWDGLGWMDGGLRN